MGDVRSTRMLRSQNGHIRWLWPEVLEISFSLIQGGCYIACLNAALICGNAHAGDAHSFESRCGGLFVIFPDYDFADDWFVQSPEVTSSRWLCFIAIRVITCCWGGFNQHIKCTAIDLSIRWARDIHCYCWFSSQLNREYHVLVVVCATGAWHTHLPV